MKNNSLNIRRTLKAVAIGLLASSSLVMGATYNTRDHQQNNFNGLKKITPLDNESETHPSILESLQQSEINNKKASYLEALNLLKQNKLEEAQNKVSALLKETPNEPEPYNIQALLDTFKKDTSAAQQSYKKAIELDQSNITARLGLAKLALDNGEIDKAKDYAKQILSFNDKTIAAYLLLANIAYKQKDSTEVEKALVTAQEKAKGNFTEEIEVIKWLKSFYVNQKQPGKMLSIGQDMVKRYPNNSMALSVLAGAEIANDKKPAAEETLQQIINLEKQDISSRFLLAKLLSEHPGKEKDVLTLLDEAAAIEPNNPQPTVFKTAFLIKLQRYPEALKLADKISIQFPKLALGKLLKGDVYLADKKLDKALDIYQKAYQIEPNNKVLLVIVDLLNTQNKTPEAIKLLNQESARNNKNGAIHFKLATIYQQQNDNKQAETHYKAILAEQPDNVLALNNLAFLYSQQNNPQALELAQQAYKKAPESAVILDTYGYILFKQGQLKEGLPILEKAASLAPKENNIQFHLAEAYSVIDNKGKAIEILEAILNTEPNSSKKQAAVNLLNKLR